jgi:hypothetical protein
MSAKKNPIPGMLVCYRSFVDSGHPPSYFGLLLSVSSRGLGDWAVIMWITPDGLEEGNEPIAFLRKICK